MQVIRVAPHPDSAGAFGGIDGAGVLEAVGSGPRCGAVRPTGPAGAGPVPLVTRTITEPEEHP
jgi:hypothetical protein